MEDFVTQDKGGGRGGGNNKNIVTTKPKLNN